jgi:hypothetical protein
MVSAVLRYGAYIRNGKQGWLWTEEFIWIRKIAILEMA